MEVVVVAPISKGPPKCMQIVDAVLFVLHSVSTHVDVSIHVQGTCTVSANSGLHGNIHPDIHIDPQT